MADTSLPSYAKLGWRDTGETPDPVVLRSEKERGVPSQRRMKADSLVAVDVTLYFDSSADAVSFEQWFYGDLAGGANWFNWLNPRTGQVVEARIVGGDMGKLVPTNPTWGWAQRSMQFEYVRKGFELLAPGSYDIAASRILSVQRNSTATYVDGSGVLQSVGVHAARYQGGLLLVEPARTNSIAQSQNLALTPWTGCSRTLAAEYWAGNVPFYECAKLLTTQEAFTSGAVAVAAGETWTLTLALLAGTKTTCSVGLYGTVTGPNGFWGEVADCTKEIISGPGTFATYSAAVGGLWHVDNLHTSIPTLVRITRTFTAAMSARLYGYPGRTSSVTVGDSIKATRVQLEKGADATSDIPTTTAAVTREADLITVAA
jgi:hypothetical protein